jgi:hypothetical protein
MPLMFLSSQWGLQSRDDFPKTKFGREPPILGLAISGCVNAGFLI